MEQTRIGIIFMGVGALMLVLPLTVTIIESSIRIFVPMIGLLFLLFGFPIILNSKKDKNIETYKCKKLKLI
ncbi:MAG TPA: hypothetical protein VK882_04740 [Nitrososphaeraceae archaeon]|nr:hypothetical protein [Nitrososphaeraceae archaeon]